MQEFISQYPWIIYVLLAWTLPWKGIALWKAAKNNNKIWFVILFLINTLAILDIIYIVFVGKEKKEEETKNNPRILSNGKNIIV
jgi:hypothetical protein